MTELQQTFLFYTMIYFMLKGAVFVAFYIVTIIIEREARIRHAQLRVYLKQKRNAEENRWQVAYQMLNDKKLAKQEQALLSKAS
ncbi:MAG: hypothetical protein GX333_08230 [Syntrophomonadaceae bacterium]|nr:hypothetical protein [Syntrophomonadaceae bacterium]